MSTTTLTVAYESLNQELSRITALLESKMISGRGGDILVTALDKINRSYLGKLYQTKSELAAISAAIKAEHAESLWEEWQVYCEAKDSIPLITKDVLAVIGGVYLQDAGLDAVGKDVGKSPRFSQLSQDLAASLAKRSGSNWTSVLIVGEEYLRQSESGIIRLRFPACDLWNLPFTAHELGYLIGGPKTQGWDTFRSLRDRVRLATSPSDPNGHHPREEEKTCFLEEVRHLWDEYKKQATEEARADFRTTHLGRGGELQEQQEAYLCRLFADVFATFFVGPAYVHALLNLRFEPEPLAKHSPYVPPFPVRFVFAFEMLKWMDKKLTERWRKDLAPNEFKLPEWDSPFFLEISGKEDPTLNLERLWCDTLKSCGQPDNYGDLRRQYGEWIRVIIGVFEPEALMLEETYKNWTMACHVEQYLKDGKKLPVDPGEDVWQLAVLNAAWSARLRHPEKTEDFEDQALNLLRLDSTERKLLVQEKQPEEPKSGASGGAPKVIANVELVGHPVER